MKPLTARLIGEHLGEQKNIKRRWLFGGFDVDLQSGASVKLTRKKIDFGKFRDPQNRTDIDEWLFQSEVKDCLALGAEVWGGISVYGGPTRADEVAVLEYAASADINTGDQGKLLRHFGQDATIKYGWHCFTITVPNRGYVKVDCGALVKVVGDLMTPALAMCHEVVPDNLVVRGKAELLLMAVHEARVMGITVIPESDMKMFLAVTANAAVLLSVALAFEWLDLWRALIVGYVGGYLFWALCGYIFWRQFRVRILRKTITDLK